MKAQRQRLAVFHQDALWRSQQPRPSFFRTYYVLLLDRAGTCRFSLLFYFLCSFFFVFHLLCYRFHQPRFFTTLDQATARISC